MALRRYTTYLRNFDWVLFGATFLLMCFGLVALYSNGMSADNPNFLDFKKQLTFAIFGLILLFITGMLDYRLWRDVSSWLYGGVTVLLVAVLFLGRTIAGTTGWFSLFGLNFQPVELAKLVLILFLARLLTTIGSEIKQLKNYIITGISAGFFFLLVILQPDFGSAMILFFICILMMLFAGVAKKHVLVSALALIGVGIVAWFFLFQPYQRDRIMTFFNPQADPYGRGYHVRQAVTAVGAGGLLGRGLGFGSQSQLKFLPASETDFIFATVAEELGFVGVSLMLFFWGLIFFRLIRAAAVMKDTFAAFFILGISALFFCQIMINIGMNIGIVPVTGISLPFMSYGGSFLVICLIAIGMAESMIMHNKNIGG